MFIKGIHNTGVDATSPLDYGLVMNDRTTWIAYVQCWCHCPVNMHTEGTSQADYKESMNLVFANCSKENAMHPLTVWEIAESQSANGTMGLLKNQPGYAAQLVENTMILCKDGKLIIPKIYRTEQLHSITINSNTQAQLVSRRLFAVKCI